jgi:hypothetical protein
MDVDSSMKVLQETLQILDAIAQNFAHSKNQVSTD